MKKKPTGWLKLYRYAALEYKKRMTDQEYRLFDVYVCRARWDKRDSERYSIVEDVSTRDIKIDHLPLWSVGKISEVRTSLIRNGFLTKLPKNRIRVENFWMYQATSRQAEQGFRCLEQGVQPTEQNIRQNEQNDKTELQDNIENLVDTFRVLPL